MAKDTRVTFDSNQSNPKKPNHKTRPHNRNTERQISYEDAENCVNEMSESFPALSTRAHRLMRQVSGSFNSQTIKVALILSVILNLLLGIPFGIFFGFWMSYKNDATSVPSTSGTASDSARLTGDRNYVTMEGCYPCPDIDISLGSKVKVRSKNDICCTDDKLPNMENNGYYFISAEYYRKKVFGNKEHNRLRLPCSPTGAQDVPVSAAHMMLDVKQTKLNVKGHGSSHEIPLAWIPKDREDRSFVGDGVLYAEGEVTIKHTGKYHVYSHMTWSTNDNKLNPGETEKIILHSINRKTGMRSSSSMLLFAQVTMKRSEVRSTNIEGTFELSEGDKISVYISYPSILKETPTANVFGLFQL